MRSWELCDITASGAVMSLVHVLGLLPGICLHAWLEVVAPLAGGTSLRCRRRLFLPE